MNSLAYPLILSTLSQFSFMAGLVIVLIVPALYEQYEDNIDRYSMMSCRKFRLLYMKLDEECISKVQKWILEKRKLS